MAVAIDCFMEHLTTITFDNRTAEFETVLQELKKAACGRKIIFGLEDVGGNGRSFAPFTVGEGYITNEVNAALAEGYR